MTHTTYAPSYNNSEFLERLDKDIDLERLVSKVLIAVILTSTSAAFAGFACWMFL